MSIVKMDVKYPITVFTRHTATACGLWTSKYSITNVRVLSMNEEAEEKRQEHIALQGLILFLE